MGIDVRRDGRKIRPDPDVARLVDGMHKQHQKRTRRLPTSEERQDAEQRRQVLRSRVTYDLPEDISQAIRDLAADLECPDSQVAAFLLQHALRLTNKIDWEKYKVHSQSPRRKFNLQIPSENRK